jgi:hypothetical protein
MKRRKVIIRYWKIRKFETSRDWDIHTNIISDKANSQTIDKNDINQSSHANARVRLDSLNSAPSVTSDST